MPGLGSVGNEYKWDESKLKEFKDLSTRTIESNKIAGQIRINTLMK